MKMRVYLVYDSGNPFQNMEQLSGSTSEEWARARAEALNERDYPEAVGLSEDELEDFDGDRWCYTSVDVEVES